jgi:hypothetical protein
LTLREALRLGHNYIGTEHVLLRCSNWKTVTVRCTKPASTKTASRPI